MLYLKHPVTGEVKQAPTGFSWTTLFFGVFVPLSRQDWIPAVVMFFAAAATRGLTWFVVPFFYNAYYLDSLIKRGFEIQ